MPLTRSTVSCPRNLLTLALSAMVRWSSPILVDDLVLNTDVAMMFSWVWLWLVLMLLFLVPSVGYGWGYRRWGPPYPRYIQRRRGERVATTGGSVSFDHHAWGWRGDFVWMVLVVGIIWVVAALGWR